MTEASPVITGTYPNEDHNFGSIGRPIPNTEMKVRTLIFKLYTKVIMIFYNYAKL